MIRGQEVLSRRAGARVHEDMEEVDEEGKGKRKNKREI
jgi:hypothetical protein